MVLIDYILLQTGDPLGHRAYRAGRSDHDPGRRRPKISGQKDQRRRLDQPQLQAKEVQPNVGFR